MKSSKFSMKHFAATGLSAGLGAAAAPFLVNAVSSARAQRAVLTSAPMVVLVGGLLLSVVAMNGIMYAAKNFAAKIPAPPSSR